MVKCKIMKKKTIIILTVIALFFAGLGAVVWWHFDNIKAIYYGFKYSPDDIESKLTHVHDDVKKYLEDNPQFSVRPTEPVEEELHKEGMITDGELTGIITGDTSVVEVFGTELELDDNKKVIISESGQVLDKETAEKLKAENKQLREQLSDYYDMKSENNRLRKYYDLKEKNPSYKIAPASVIKRDTNDDFYSFTLDVGSNQGVHINAPVITENGLVGWVCNADATTCKVKTILSPDTKASALDKQTSDSGIISGNATLCKDGFTSLNKLTENNKIQNGDMIVTSGTGGVYPQDLLIGKVVEVKFNAYDTSRYAVIEPYEDIANITAAAVITDF